MASSLDLVLVVFVALVLGVAAGAGIALVVRSPSGVGPTDQAGHAALVHEQARAMRAELDRVTDLIGALQVDRARQHGEVVARLADATRQSQALTDTTQSLRQALASPKARGQWGERMADDVLRLAGLIEGVNYRRQTGVAGGGIPDVTFLLPGGRELHMDVKFPVDNYLRALEAGSEVEAAASTAAFGRDVRLRIKELTTRAYIDPAVTLDYVLAFIPNESVYTFMHEHDPALVDYALGQRVVLCSPFTLFAVLSVIRQAVDSFNLERTSDEILQCLGAFGREWGRFSDQVDLLGRRLESTQRAWDDLAGTRRKALQRHLDTVDDLRRSAGLGGEVVALAAAERPRAESSGGGAFEDVDTAG